MPFIIFNLHNVFQAFVANIETFIPVREIKDMEQGIAEYCMAKTALYIYCQ